MMVFSAKELPKEVQAMLEDMSEYEKKLGEQFYFYLKNTCPRELVVEDTLNEEELIFEGDFCDLLLSDVINQGSYIDKEDLIYYLEEATKNEEKKYDDFIKELLENEKYRVD